jgi:acyl-coenzyme A thioesterase PaaI-like protein
MALHQATKLLTHLKSLQLPRIQQEVFTSLQVLDAKGEEGSGSVKYQFRIGQDLVNVQGFMKDDTLLAILDSLSSLSVTTLDTLGRSASLVQIKLSKFGRNRVGQDLTLQTSVRAIGRDMAECEACLALGENVIAHLRSFAYLE